MVTERIIADFGNSVYCDTCNDDYTNRDDLGGCLIGSYALCPTCTNTAEDRNPEEIGDRCPAGVTFRDWVLSLRNGDNCARIYSADDPREMEHLKP